MIIDDWPCSWGLRKQTIKCSTCKGWVIWGVNHSYTFCVYHQPCWCESISYGAYEAPVYTRPLWKLKDQRNKRRKSTADKQIYSHMYIPILATWRAPRWEYFPHYHIQLDIRNVDCACLKYIRTGYVKIIMTTLFLSFFPSLSVCAAHIICVR